MSLESELRQAKIDIAKLQSDMNAYKRLIKVNPWRVMLKGNVNVFKYGAENKGGIFIPSPVPIGGISPFGGDSYSTTSKTAMGINNYVQGLKAMYVALRARDSGSAGGAAYFGIGPNTDALSMSVAVDLTGIANDQIKTSFGIALCDANGEAYFECGATGEDTLDLWFYLWGFWI